MPCNGKVKGVDGGVRQRLYSICLTKAPIHRMAPKNFYAVARGHRPGIYLEWDGYGGAREATDGFSGGRFKGFDDEQSARDYMERWAPKLVLTSHVTHHQPAATVSEHFHGGMPCDQDSKPRELAYKKLGLFSRLASLVGIMGGLMAICLTGFLAWNVTGSVQ